MASKTPTGGRLGQVYRNRIGEPSTDDEVRGYWVFTLGVMLVVGGFLLFMTSQTTGDIRQWAIVLLGAGLVLLIAGPVIRLPLRQMATWFVYLGIAMSALAIVWFVTVYPGQWGQQTGNISVMLLYGLGLLVIAASGVLVPILTAREELEAKVSALQTEINGLQETVRESEADEAEVAKKIAEVRSDLQDEKADTAALEREMDQLRSDVADTEADEADLAAILREHRASQSQFELYKDRGQQWRWRLRHRDGHVIAGSNKGYDRQNDAQTTMQALRRDAYGATVLVVENEMELPEEGTDMGFVFPDTVESQATFELYEDVGDEYRWRLRHRNGDIIATAGEGYVSRDGAETSIKGIRKYVGPADYLQPDPTAIEIYRDEANQWRWRLLHKNGNNLAASGEGYADRTGARSAIDRLREEIDDMTIEVYEDEDGDFRWRIQGEAEDSNIVVDSGGYESESGAKRAVERVRKFLPEADLIDVGEAAFEIYEDEGGDHRWRLRHRNGNILATASQGYASRTGVWDGIESVKRNAPDAELEATED